MDLQGKIIAVLPEREGENARGKWVVQEFVLETLGNYPRKMMFSVFGADRLQRFNIQMGQEVNVSFDIDAHEYNGRWFNSVRAYDVRPVSLANAAPGAAPVAPQAAAAPAGGVVPQVDPLAPMDEGSEDDLPF